jgi:hypothetical protein
MIKDHDPRSTSDVLDIPYALFIVCSPDRFFVIERRSSTRNVVELKTRGVEGEVSRFLTAANIFNLDVKRGWRPVLGWQI